MTAPKNPKGIGLPVTVSTAQASANLVTAARQDAERAARRGGRQPSMGALHPVESSPFGRPNERVPTKAERDAASLKASYLVGDPTPSRVDLTKDLPGQIMLEVTNIDCFDNNPRIFVNEATQDIENSIRATGFRDALVVTRRQPGDRYMLAAGSNTTLKILQRLWATTQDEKFRYVNCIYQPYVGEARVLAQHLGENLNRGNMRFWEVAKGMMALADHLQAEHAEKEGEGKRLSLRDLEEQIGKRGLRAPRSSLTRWAFAAERLAELGAATVHLTKESADQLQPRLNSLRVLAAKFKIDEDRYWKEVVNPTLAAYARDLEGGSSGTFDASALGDLVDAALAVRVDESVTSIRQMLSMLRLSPELTLADLRVPSPNVAARPPGTGRSHEAAAVVQPTAEPSPTHQAPLPLPPAVVRSDSSRPEPPVQSAALEPHSAQVVAASTEPAAASGPLFAEAEGQDPLASLHSAVRGLLATANLSDTVRWLDTMPLGFFVELPDPVIHARKKVSMGSPEYEARKVKTLVWWSLVLMTGQFREGCVPFIDKGSAFFKHYSADGEQTPLHGTDIDEQAPDVDEILMQRLTPGAMRAVMRQMRAVEELAGRVFEQRPERWRRMLEVQRRGQP